MSGPGSTTLPMEVFSAVRLGVKPEINAIASLILLAVSLFTFFAWYFTRRAEKKRLQGLQEAMDATASEITQRERETATLTAPPASS